jgi:hypothetical protein
MSDSGKLHLTEGTNEPYKTEAAAKAAQSKKTFESEIVKFGGGYALKDTGRQKPAEAIKEIQQTEQEDRQEKPKTTRPDRNAILSAKRARRKEVSTRDPLEAHSIPGMVLRWVRDTEREGGRKVVSRMKRGWSLVEIQNGVPTAVEGDVNRGGISDRYVTMPGGEGATLYLMAIEEELFQEDRDNFNKTQDIQIEQIRKSAMRPDIEGSGLSWTVTKSAPK